jgi:hypothetical protein
MGEGDTGVVREDVVNHPRWYTSHGSNVECIELTEAMDFCPGNAFKYVWRFREKGGKVDLAKALWYVDRELDFRQGERGSGVEKAIMIARVAAYEPSPTVAMILWLLFAGDGIRGEDGSILLKQAKVMIEELIYDADPATR